MQLKNWLVALVVAATLALTASACGGGDAPDDASTTPPRPTVASHTPQPAHSPTPGRESATVEAGTTPTPPAAVTSVPTGTGGDGGEDGISAVQAVIDAASGGDVVTLRAFVRTTGVACVTVVEGIGGPPECRAGEAEGTVVQVVQVADCEGHLDRTDDLALPLYEGGVAFVDAYRAPDGFAIAGDTVLVFETSSPGIGEQGIAIVMDGGAITGFYNGCGQTVAQLVEALGLGEPIVVEPGT